MIRFLAFILDLIFPKICLGCQKPNPEGNILCRKCLENIPINSGWFCPICQRRLPAPENPCHPKIRFVLAAAAPYAEKAAQETIQALKYRQLENAAKDLEIILKKYLEKTKIVFADWLPEETLILPIPLHPKKEKDRGFNQSWLLAQACQKILTSQYPEKKFHAEKNAISRIKNIPSQTKCRNYEQREENIKNAFMADSQKIKNKTVIIIDDVFTSGATIREAAAIIKAAGARKVMALTIAKA